MITPHPRTEQMCSQGWTLCAAKVGMSVLPRREAEARVRRPPLRIGAHPLRLVPVGLCLQGVLQSEGGRRAGGSLKFEATPVSWFVLQGWYVGQEGNRAA